MATLAIQLLQHQLQKLLDGYVLNGLKTEVGLNKLDNIDCFKTAVFENGRQPGFKQPQASKYPSQNPYLNQVLFS